MCEAEEKKKSKRNKQIKNFHISAQSTLAYYYYSDDAHCSGQVLNLNNARLRSHHIVFHCKCQRDVSSSHFALPEMHIFIGSRSHIIPSHLQTLSNDIPCLVDSSRLAFALLLSKHIYIYFTPARCCCFEFFFLASSKCAYIIECICGASCTLTMFLQMLRPERVDVLNC